MARRVKSPTSGATSPRTGTKSVKTAVVDLVREHRDSYGAGREPALVELAPALFLAASGRGDPNGADFGGAVGALYASVYTIKFTRRACGSTFKVAPLEGLWWGRALTGDFTDQPRESWNWLALIRVPEDVTQAELEAALAKLEAKGRPARRVRLEWLHEGRVVQALHVGPYSSERATIERLHAFAHERGLEFNGRHHELYLCDPRRTAPERLRTILRVPVGPAAA
jgi:hypothetical protein